MKLSVTLALAAMVAFGTAKPHKHAYAHHQQKRDAYTTTIIDDVTETVNVLTTIWVDPAQANVYTSSQPTSLSAAPAPQQKEVASVASQAPPAPSAPAAAPVPVNTPASIVPVEAAAIPVPSSTPTTVVPVQSSTPAAPVPAASSPSVPSGDVSGATSQAPASFQQNNVKMLAGNVTTYDGGRGACGWTNDTKSTDFFALAYEMMGTQSNGSPYCGRMADLVYNGQTFSAQLVDKCMGCGGVSIDLSSHLFEKMFNTDTGNFHNQVTWYFTS